MKTCKHCKGVFVSEAAWKCLCTLVKLGILTSNEAMLKHVFTKEGTSDFLEESAL